MATLVLRQLALMCDMERGCALPVTHIDEKGFVYCQSHGHQRQVLAPLP